MRLSSFVSSLLLVGALSSRALADASTVSLLPAGGPLDVQLKREALAAKKKGLRSFAELTADWCKPCRAVTKYLGDPRMVDALSGVHLIRIDADAFTVEQLEKSKLAAPGVPFFFELDDQGKATGRKLSSSVWAEDIPENMAPPLKAFFHKAR